MHTLLPTLTIDTALELSMSWRLLLAVVLGACLGLERSLAGKHAGMRTYALVTLGSCLFVVAGTLASYSLSAFAGVNPLQIASSVVLGVGFIGSGLVAFRGGGEYSVELTTATGLWVAAGVGMALGFGFYVVALSSTALALIVFSLLLRVETALRKRYGTEGQ